MNLEWSELSHQTSDLELDARRDEMLATHTHDCVLTLSDALTLVNDCARELASCWQQHLFCTGRSERRAILRADARLEDAERELSEWSRRNEVQRTKCYVDNGLVVNIFPGTNPWDDDRDPIEMYCDRVREDQWARREPDVFTEG